MFPSVEVGEVLHIEKRKRPLATGTWAAYVVAHDEHGLWLFTPKGSLYRGEKDGQVAYLEVGQGHREAGVDVLHLAPVGEWWFAAWHVVDEPTVTIDVCMPPLIQGGCLQYVDLEIDLYRKPTGQHGVIDVDEFEDACAAGWISESERAEAEATTTSLSARIEREDYLFDGVGWTIYADACAQRLPPLTTLGA